MSDRFSFSQQSPITAELVTQGLQVLRVGLGMGGAVLAPASHVDSISARMAQQNGAGRSIA